MTPIRHPQSPFMPPEPGVAHLWRFSLRADDAEERALARLLSPDEQERAARFRFPEHRRRFVAARGALRRLLASYLHLRPEDVCFRYGPQGKPALDVPGTPDLRFNLSHSGDQALFALAVGAEVGVDLEEESARHEAEAIARRFFHAAEADAVCARTGAALDAAFFRIWTLKEAYVKACGTGLSMPLQEFAFVLPEGLGPVPFLVTGPPEERERWSAFAVGAPAGYAAAVVLEGAPWRIEEREWPPEP